MSRKPLPFLLWLTSFWRDRRAVVAVEFALVGPIFLLLLLVTFELGLVLFTQSVLDTATQEAARLIALGQANSKSDFTTKLCATITIVPCADLQVNVQSAASFGNFSATIKTDGNGHLINPQYSPGTSGQSVLVQVAYNRQYIVSLVGDILGNNESLLIVSSAAFQSEPY